MYNRRDLLIGLIVVLLLALIGIRIWSVVILSQVSQLEPDKAQVATFFEQETGVSVSENAVTLYKTVLPSGDGEVFLRQFVVSTSDQDVTGVCTWQIGDEVAVCQLYQ